MIPSFTAHVPAACVVRLPGAHHDVFLSDEADVLREMRAFLSRVR
jgi:non-heme chloroperoxidase